MQAEEEEGGLFHSNPCRQEKKGAVDEWQLGWRHHQRRLISFRPNSSVPDSAHRISSTDPCSVATDPCAVVSAPSRSLLAHKYNPPLFILGSLLLHTCACVRTHTHTHASLPTPFYSVIVSVSVFIAISTVFQSINSPDNSPLSRSVLPVLFLGLIGPFNYISLDESLLQP